MTFRPVVRPTLCAAAAVAVLASAVCAGPAQAAGSSDRCDARTYLSGASGHQHRHTYATILSTESVRVYRTRDEDSASYYVCSRQTDHAHRLGQDALAGAETTDVQNDGFVAQGPYVAFRHVESGRRNLVRVTSVDARTGHTRRTSGDHPIPAGLAPTSPQLVVTTTGSMGWVAPDGVLITDATGTRVVGAGAATDLATVNRTLYWTAGDAPHAAPID
jgi:hypothetical protein